MDSTGFDPTNWSHWLLLGCCAVTSAWVLMLSWRWNEHQRMRRKWHKRAQVEQRQIEQKRAELKRQMATNLLYGASRLPQEGPRLSAIHNASRK